MNKLSIGLSVLALAISLVVLFGGGTFGVPNANCNGRAYCTAFPALLSQYATTTSNMEVQGTLIASGLTLGTSACATATWNATAISSSTAASTTVSLSGAVLGDILVASFNSATSTNQWFVAANVNGSGTTTVNIVPIEGTPAWNTGLTLGTSTVRVCKIH